MKIALIGSNSFLAKYIIREFLANQQEPALFGINRPAEFPGLEFSRFHLPDFQINLNALLDFDFIIYAAGAGIQTDLHESTELIYELNSFTPIRILNFLASNNFKGKVITFGSYFEIGDEPEERFYKEEEVASSRNKVPNHYAASKRLLTRFLHSEPELPVHFHFILPNIYGVGENPNRLIPYLVNALKLGTEIRLTSGTQVRQYLHASDIARMVRLTAGNDYPGGIYNLCNREPVQVKTLVKLIFTVMNKDAELQNLEFGSNRRTDTVMPYLLLDHEKASRELSFKPELSLEKGIQSYL